MPPLGGWQNLVARNNRRPSFSPWAEMGEGSLYENTLPFLQKHEQVHTHKHIHGAYTQVHTSA